MFQQILIMSTRKGNLRSEAFGWTAEDSAQVLRYAKNEHYYRHVEIGRIPAWDRDQNGSFQHEAPLYAMAAGWKLMAPPKQAEDGTWEWWFTRD
jgi:hypothetical protein